ncbi:MAG: efflux RND transporter permease subunit [Myxococcota bacterium]
MTESGEGLSRFTRWLLRYRRWVLLVSTLIALVAGARTVRTYAALKSDLEELLPTSAPSVAALSALRARLPGIRHLGVVVAIDRPDGEHDAIRFLEALRDRIAKYPKSLVAKVRVDSRAEREFLETYALSLMDPEDVRALREAVERRRDWDVSRQMGLDLESDADEARPEIPLDELMRKYEARFGKPRVGNGDHFISPDHKSAVLLVQVASHDTGQRSDAELLERVKADVASLNFPAAFGGGLRVGYAGDVAARVEEARGLESDLTWSSLAVLLLVGGSLVWFYRSAWSIPILCIPLAVGTVAAFGFVALPPLHITALNTNTAFLGSIVIGNGINSGIILLARFLEERRGGLSVDTSIDRALHGTYKATLAASLAAAVAYGSLIVTDFRGFNQFGWIGAAGLMSCWLANYTLLPVLTRLWGARLGTLGSATPTPDKPSAASWALQHSRLLLAVTLGLSVLAGAGLAQRAGDWIEYDLSKLRRRDSWDNGERYWGKRMDAALGTYLTPTVVLAGSDDEVRRIEERLIDLKAKGAAGGLIGSVRSAELFRSPARDVSRAEARQLAQVLTPRLLSQLAPKDRALVERALSPRSLEPFGAKDIPEVLLAGLKQRDGSFAPNVLVYPKLGNGTWNAELLDAYSKDLRQAATIDGVARPVAGSLLLSSDIARAMNADGPKATRVSLLAVLLICLLAFRSSAKSGERSSTRDWLGYSLAAMVSLAFGVLLMMGSLAWTSQRINFSNFVALPITFGVGADYAINVLRRHQSESSGSLSRALDSTSGAVALCSATTVIGFGSLLMAQNRALFSFGVFAITGELACLATAVLVLPAAVSLWSKRQRRDPYPSRLAES